MDCTIHPGSADHIQSPGQNNFDQFCQQGSLQTYHSGATKISPNFSDYSECNRPFIALLDVTLPTQWSWQNNYFCCHHQRSIGPVTAFQVFNQNPTSSFLHHCSGRLPCCFINWHSLKNQGAPSTPPVEIGYLGAIASMA